MLKWGVNSEQHLDDQNRPLGLDKKPFKFTIVERWRGEKFRMDYHAHSNTTTGSGYHLKGYDELSSFVAKALRKGYQVEIIPDYKKPEGN